jgi:hypothetical protein
VKIYSSHKRILREVNRFLEITFVNTPLLLPIRVNHSIRLAQDYTTKWELAWPKLPQGSTIFEWKNLHP